MMALNPGLRKRKAKFLLLTLIWLLFSCIFYLPAPEVAFAEQQEILEITGEGVTTKLAFTLDDLKAMEQYEHIYSTINTWPTKRWYMARGVKLRELLALAGIKEEATLLKIVGKDDYEMTLTVKELLEDKRYYFPGLKENHPTDGSIPGSPEGAVEVEPILALVSAEDSDNPDHMDDRNGLMLVIGQRAVTEQTWLLFTKWVKKIEVLTTPLEKWDAPKTDIPDGSVVPIGFKLELKNKNTDADKIYYTTDGSTPTVNSPMFNWSARRWWEQRKDVDSINIPIEIVEEMISKSRDGRDVVVLKTRTIGPGKLDSDVATFTFTVDPDAVDPTKAPGGPPTGIILDRNEIKLSAGSTYRLEATVEPFNAEDKSVIWHSSDTSVATVDTGGLVTVVGPGTAVITVETADGKYSASCVINGPEGNKDEQVVPAEDSVSPENEVPQEAEEVLLAEENLLIDDSITGEEAAETLSEPPESAREDNGGDTGDEPVIPEGRGKYLARKEDLAAVSATGVTDQTEKRSHRVYEMSLDASVPLPLPEQQTNPELYTAVIFMFLFLSGASKKYLEYAKELYVD